jgi:hypothetical protein
VHRVEDSLLVGCAVIVGSGGLHSRKLQDDRAFDRRAFEYIVVPATLEDGPHLRVAIFPYRSYSSLFRIFLRVKTDIGNHPSTSVLCGDRSPTGCQIFFRSVVTLGRSASAELEMAQEVAPGSGRGAWLPEFGLSGRSRTRRAICTKPTRREPCRCS